MRQKRWIELFSDYDCEIRYHPGKANVVADTLSRKERVKPRRVRAMSMTIQSSIKDKLLAAQNEATREENALLEMLCGLDQQMEKKEYGGLYFVDRIWVPLIGDVRKIIMDEAHSMRYSIHPGADKSQRYLSVDRLTKSAHFLAIREDYEIEKLSRLYIDKSVSRHGVLVSIISNYDGRFTSRFWQILQKALGTRLDMSTTYHLQTDEQSEHTIRTLEDMLRACETTNKVALIKERFKAARDRQKSYANNRRKMLEFEVGPFEILERIGHVAYHLILPQELSNIHDTFHVSNLNKCLEDANLHVPLEEIRVDKTLRFVEELEEIIDREVKKLKRSRIPIVKVRWNSKRGPEFTWEHEDFMKAKYLDLFVKRVGGSTS
ncbi:putative reverse transcriptase domain-containing protein [Tanacetum coccineum]